MPVRRFVTSLFGHARLALASRAADGANGSCQSHQLGKTPSGGSVPLDFGEYQAHCSSLILTSGVISDMYECITVK